MPTATPEHIVVPKILAMDSRKHDGDGAIALAATTRTTFDEFPYNPYPIQQGFMEALYETLENGDVGLFESPTGELGDVRCVPPERRCFAERL